MFKIQLIEFIIEFRDSLFMRNVITNYYCSTSTKHDACSMNNVLSTMLKQSNRYLFLILLSQTSLLFISKIEFNL